MIIETRNWSIENFTKEKLENTLKKIIEENNILERIDTTELIDLFDNYLEKSVELERETIHINEIEDIFIKFLNEEKPVSNYFEISKAFFIHNYELDKKASNNKDKVQKKLENNKLKIRKSNWRKEIFDIEKIKKTYKKISPWLGVSCRWDVIEESLRKYIVDDMKTADILRMLIKSAVDLISTENTDWQIIAGRLKIVNLYKQAIKNRKIKMSEIYSWQAFKLLFDDYIEKGHYYKDFYKYYSEDDIIEAWNYLNRETDMTYNFSTVSMYEKRYLLNPNKEIRELPQEMYMSIALFLAIPEPKEKRLDIAKKIYEYCSEWKISLPTPTLLNSRTNFHQLSSCFKFNVWDDLRAIYHNIENMAQVSKFGWWIGVYLWNIRSKWGSIRWNENVAGWVNPWIKVINDTAVAVNQLWARAGAISVTLDCFHRDIFDFLDIQTETWDIRWKSFDVFPAVTFPDLFMERVAEDKEWTLFDPKEVKDIFGYWIQDKFGQEFEDFYTSCENDDRLKLKETVKAKDLFRKYMKANVETGMPYAFFRDTANKFNPNKHSGNVYSTQLCCEIIQNTSPSKFIEEEIDDGKIRIEYEAWDNVVCNLASINVAKVNTDEEIEKVIPIAMRVLDNVIDLNFYPIKETKITAEKYRSVGLWFLWLAEHLAANMKMNYSSLEARQHVDKLFEKYAYRTLKSSNELSKEKWSYPLYEGSDWSKGILLWKNKEWFKENSEMYSEWSELIDNVKKYWMRFGYHLSPAPNTSTSLVVWTTAGVLPIYKKYFVETNSVAPMVNVAPRLSKENFWYYQEYVNLDQNDVIDMMTVIYKWIDQAISFEWIINPQKTSPKDLYDYYMKAHKQWIKTVYYVRSMSLDVKSCESCSW